MSLEKETFNINELLSEINSTKLDISKETFSENPLFLLIKRLKNEIYNSPNLVSDFESDYHKFMENNLIELENIKKEIIIDHQKIKEKNPKLFGIMNILKTMVGVCFSILSITFIYGLVDFKSNGIFNGYTFLIFLLFFAITIGVSSVYDMYNRQYQYLQQPITERALKNKFFSDEQVKKRFETTIKSEYFICSYIYLKHKTDDSDFNNFLLRKLFDKYQGQKLSEIGKTTLYSQELKTFESNVSEVVTKIKSDYLVQTELKI